MHTNTKEYTHTHTRKKRAHTHSYRVFSVQISEGCWAFFLFSLFVFFSLQFNLSSFSLTYLSLFSFSSAFTFGYLCFSQKGFFLVFLLQIFTAINGRKNKWLLYLTHAHYLLIGAVNTAVISKTYRVLRGFLTDISRAACAARQQSLFWQEYVQN